MTATTIFAAVLSFCLLVVADSVPLEPRQTASVSTEQSNGQVTVTPGTDLSTAANNAVTSGISAAQNATNNLQQTIGTAVSSFQNASRIPGAIFGGFVDATQNLVSSGANIGNQMVSTGVNVTKGIADASTNAITNGMTAAANMVGIGNNITKAGLDTFMNFLSPFSRPIG